MGMEAGAVTLAEALAEDAPSAPGVYALYRGGELTYLGLAEQGESISESLENHRNGACAGCAQQATAFTYELTHDPRRRHWQHLSRYRERHEGRVPPCNACQPCGC